MPEQRRSPSEAAAQAAIAAALLGLGRSLERGSLLLTAAAFVALVAVPLAILPRLCLCLAVAAGLAAQFFALRTAFDQPLFAAWAHRWRTAEADPEDDLITFDSALAAAGLRPTATGPLRPLIERIAGARRLLRRQGWCCGVQIAGWLAACLTIALTS
ncbi:hypothetical protein AB6Q56_06160 [Dechloromonas sp. ARDL1]|uniref:hypothetical protein n=1 Tax=Dechloromonas sp. ARDL1 TaxID=3322121 RepID=UPI003DA70587